MSDKKDARDFLVTGSADDVEAAVKKSNSVYYTSILVTLALVLWELISSESFGLFANKLFNVLTDYFGWGYMLTMNIFVAFCIILALSRFGKVRLGPKESRPEYSNASWFAIFGTSSLHLELVKGVQISADVLKDISIGIFEMYKHYPLGSIMSLCMVVLMAALAIVLLMTGGLQNLQTISLTVAPPFSIIIVCACVSMWKMLVFDEKQGMLY